MAGFRPAAASLMVNKGRRGESHALSIDLGIMKLENVLKLTVPFVLGAATMSVAQLQPPLTLEVPLACRFGEICFVQQYFDHDPGPGAKNYRCSPMVYDGHDGVDLRVPTMAHHSRLAYMKRNMKCVATTRPY